MGSAQTGLPMMRRSNLGFLAFELILKDFRVRYRNMSLGVFWSLLNPLTMMALLTFVFTQVFQSRIPHYPLYVLCGLIPYNFFTLSVVTATLSISENAALVKRVPMPTALLPLVSVLSNSIHLVIQLTLVLALVAWYGLPVTWHYLWLPLIWLLELLFIYGLALANQMIRGGQARYALVIGAEILTRYVDYTDRSTCVIFGDGAGAVVLQPTERRRGVLSIDLGAIPGTGALLEIPGGGCRLPATHESVEAGQHFMTMQGREVFKLAVRAMGDSCAKVIADAGLTPADVSLLVPHQANIRILEATAKRLDLPMERVFVNIDRYGNTSAATIPIALCEADAAGLLHDGDNLVLTAFGGGLTWASAVVRWGR